MKHKTSILIITRQREKILEKCLIAIDTQTLKPNEIIVVEDVSEKKFLNKKLIHKLINKKVRIKHISVKFGSYSKSRNVAIKEASNDILIFLDDDCIIEKNFIQKSVNFHQSHKNSAGFIPRIVPQTKNIYADYYSLILTPSTKNTRLKWFTFTCAVLKKSCFKNLSFDENTNTGEDIIMSNQICKLRNIYYNPDIKVTHYFSDNLSSFIKKQLNYGLDFIYQDKILKNDIDKTYYPKRKWQLILLPLFIIFNTYNLASDEIKYFNFPNKYLFPSFARHFAIHLAIYKSKVKSYLLTLQK